WTAATIGRVARRIATGSRLGNPSTVERHTRFQLPRTGDGAAIRTHLIFQQTEHPTPSLTRERPVTAFRPVLAGAFRHTVIARIPGGNYERAPWSWRPFVFKDRGLPPVNDKGRPIGRPLAIQARNVARRSPAAAR